MPALRFSFPAMIQARGPCSTSARESGLAGHASTSRRSGSRGDLGRLSRLVAGDLGFDGELLDERQRQLGIDGAGVDLTPLEFDLVCYLLRARRGARTQRSTPVARLLE